MHNFRQTSQGDKTAEILVQNVPQPSKMFPRHACDACAFFHVCCTTVGYRLYCPYPKGHFPGLGGRMTPHGHNTSIRHYETSQPQHIRKFELMT